MAKFLSGNNLNAAVENIFREASDKLVLISPYVKLHERYKSSLLNHRQNDKLCLVIVFGKNEDNISKSMSEDDLNFFKEFPNVEIRYEKRLHAKYYSNGEKSILTSMNLYSFSQDNNIEAGILMEEEFFATLDEETGKYFTEVISQSDLIFKKTPNYEGGIMGLLKKYTGSIIELDKTSDFFKKDKNDFKPDVKLNQGGFCIRTGTKIPFNVEKPLSADAYKSWSKYGDRNYGEKYCHFSGEHSNGETSVSRPILQKNWRKAKEVFGV